MVLKDYMDTSKLQDLQNSFSEAAGLEAGVGGGGGETGAGGARFFH